MTSTNRPDGRYVQYTYDSGGRRQQTTTPEGLELVYSYDSAGRAQKISPNAPMTDWFTGDNAAGIDPNKWTRQYLNGGTASIDNARMKMATTTTAGSSAGVTSKAPQTADETVTVTYQAASTSGANAGTFEVLARQDGTGANSYRLELPSDGTTGKLIKKVSGTDTQIGTPHFRRRVRHPGAARPSPNDGPGEGMAGLGIGTPGTGRRVGHRLVGDSSRFHAAALVTCRRRSELGVGRRLPPTQHTGQRADPVRDLHL